MSTTGRDAEVVEAGTLADSAGGGLLGGLVATAFVVAVTSLIKVLLAAVTRQDRWVLLAAPLAGLALAVVVLHRVAGGEAAQRLVEVPGGVPRRFWAWLRFPANVLRADLTADVVANAGTEERFPWRLAPIRAVAILATVGLGAPMGTESPAAHLGVAAGASLERAGGRWRRLARPAALGGGAAGVAALMGLPLVGLAFMIELGRRNRAPVSLPRVVAAACGALVGWAVNQLLGLSLIRLVVPTIAPRDLLQALGTAALVGGLSGALCSLTGSLVYRARKWKAGTITRLVVGGAVVLGCALVIGRLATPAAAVGPGAGAVAWAEATNAAWSTLLAVALLRAVATTAAVAAGGCGGLFVPFLSIGDLCGRVVGPGLGATGQLAAAAGSAGGIAGGYRLPITAITMVVSIGGPVAARITCVATVAFAAGAGAVVAFVLDLLGNRQDPGPRPIDPDCTNG
ncbi:MAG: chloride channel protein [Ilumatobacteraceae bacterium]